MKINVYEISKYCHEIELPITEEEFEEKECELNCILDIVERSGGYSLGDIVYEIKNLFGCGKLIEDGSPDTEFEFEFEGV